MRRMPVMGVLAVLCVALIGGTALGCEFLFSYRSIEAPIGTWGEVGIRVHKDHSNCTLPHPFDYDITVKGLQILSETPWQEIQRNVIEKWLVVSLAEEGEGYLMISKDCSKEGYQEARMPVTVGAPNDGGAWAQAWNGSYPFELPEGSIVQSAFGIPTLSGADLAVGDERLRLPSVPTELGEAVSPVRVFMTTRDGEVIPLLIVGEGLFWRYDHLLDRVLAG